jgi:hypothetical protein
VELQDAEHTPLFTGNINRTVLFVLASTFLQVLYDAVETFSLHALGTIWVKSISVSFAIV